MNRRTKLISVVVLSIASVTGGWSAAPLLRRGPATVAQGGQQVHGTCTGSPSIAEAPGPRLAPPGSVPVTYAELDALLAPPSQQVASDWGYYIHAPGGPWPDVMRNIRHTPSPSNPTGDHPLVALPGGSPSGTLSWDGGLGPYLFTGVEIDGLAPGNTSGKWAFRGYGVRDWTWDLCRFKRITKEHGAYVNSVWNLNWDRCIMEDIGSQGVQSVWRDAEAFDPADANDPYGTCLGSRQDVDRSVFMEVGGPGGMQPSYCLSFFERQPWNGLRLPISHSVMRSWFEADQYPNFAVSGGPYFSYGAVMAHGRGHIVIDASEFRYLKPNRALIQVWNCESLRVLNSNFLEGLIDIRNVPVVHIENNVELAGGQGVYDITRVMDATGPLYTPPYSTGLTILHNAPVDVDYHKVP